MAYALSQAGSSRSGGAPSNLSAVLLAHALQTGALKRNIQDDLVPTYARRYQILLEAVSKHLMPLGVELPYVNATLSGRQVAGGYFMWLRLPSSLSADLVTQLAQDHENLIVSPEKLCRVPLKTGMPQSSHDRHIRLCFAWEDETMLGEGVRRLASIISRMLSGNISALEGSSMDFHQFG